MQLQVKVAPVGVQPHVAFLLHKLVAQHVLVNGGCEQRPKLCACPNMGAAVLHARHKSLEHSPAPGRAKGPAWLSTGAWGKEGAQQLRGGCWKSLDPGWEGKEEGCGAEGQGLREWGV